MSKKAIGVIVSCILVVALIVVLARPGVEPAQAIVDRAEGITTVSGAVDFSVSMADKDEAQVQVLVEDEFTGQPVEGMAVELVVTATTLEVLLHDPQGDYLPGVFVFEQDKLDHYSEIRIENPIIITLLTVTVALLKTWGLVKFVAGGVTIMAGGTVPLVSFALNSFVTSLAVGGLWAVTQHMASSASPKDTVSYPITIYVFEEPGSDYATDTIKVQAGTTWEEIDDAVRGITGDIEVEVVWPTENPAGAYYHPDGTPKVLYVYPLAPEESAAEETAPEEPLPEPSPDLEPSRITLIAGELNPDWTRIAFARGRHLFTADADGKNEEAIAELLYTSPRSIFGFGSPSYHFAWSPSGEKIAYGAKVEIDGWVRHALKVVSWDGAGEVILQARGAEYRRISWSQDESMVYYPDADPYGRVYVHSADGSEPPKTVKIPLGTYHSVVGPVRVTSDGVVAVIAGAQYSVEVWEMGLDGEKRTALFAQRDLLGATRRPYMRQFMSPDLQKIAFVDSQGLSILRMDGSILFQSTELQRLSVYWSPDSQRVAYIGREEIWAPGRGEHVPMWSIWVMTADGTDRRKIIESEDIVGIYGWSADGSKIAYTTGDEEGVLAVPVA